MRYDKGTNHHPKGLTMASIKPKRKPTARQRARLILQNGYFQPEPGRPLVYVICPNGCGHIEAYQETPFGTRSAERALQPAIVEHLEWDAREQAAGDRA